MITTFFTEERSFTDAIRYKAREGTKEYYIKIFEAMQEANRIAPAFNQYLAYKELELGKSAKYFTEIEKSEAIEEFKKMQQSANLILKEGI